jgi:hypothetical protein
MKIKRSKRKCITSNIAEELIKTVENLSREYHRYLSIEIKKVYAYIYEGDGPLCRLRYLGRGDSWSFAVFKYSSMTYSSNEPIFLAEGSMRDCIEESLKAYS